MKFDPTVPPRLFPVGAAQDVTIADCGRLALAPDEQVTLTTPEGAEYDITRKDWGFYATPSLNGRLAGFGLKAVLVHNPASGRYFVMLVEAGHEAAFDTYLSDQKMAVVCWLDHSAALDRLRSLLEH
jgi:hypothetical protein